jgi:porin
LRNSAILQPRAWAGAFWLVAALQLGAVAAFVPTAAHADTTGGVAPSPVPQAGGSGKNEALDFGGAGVIPSEEPLFTASPIQDGARWLYDHGIYITAGYIGQAATNVSGGQRQSSDYAGKVDFGAAFDMKKLAGIDGATINLLFTDDHGSSLSGKAINSDLSVQNVFVGSQTYQLAVLTWEQKLFHNTVDLNFGRTDFAFLYSPLYCDFQSHADCGRISPGLVKNTTSGIYPTAVWGGRAQIDWTPHIFTRVGIYQPNPDLTPQESHGFNFSIRTSGVSGGFEAPVEVGYRFTNPGATVENRYAIGYIKSQEQFSATFFSKALLPGRSLAYVTFQQLLWQFQQGSPRGLYGFGEGLLDTSGNEEAMHYQGTLGLVWQGPFASRPKDRVGLMVNRYHMNNLFLKSEFATRAKEDGTEFPFANQSTGEINYSYQVTPWMQVLPNVQYIVHPDGLGFNPFPTHNLPNALVIGLAFSVDLAAMAGLPSYPWSAVVDN